MRISEKGRKIEWWAVIEGEICRTPVTSFGRHFAFHRNASYMVKWVEREKELVPRLINVGADINAIREKVGSDASLVGDYICEEIKEKADGQRTELLINDFKKFRRYPQILDDEVIYTAIRNLHRDKRVVIQ